MPTTSVQEWTPLNGFSSVCVYHKEKTWQRQAAPYVKPLAYYMWTGRNKGNGPWSDPRNNGFMADIHNYGSTHKAIATNAALDRLSQAVRGAKGSGLGIQATKLKQSFEMISKRGTQLVEAASALKSGNLGRFLNVFGLVAKKKHKRHVRRRDGTWAPITLQEGNAGFGYSETFRSKHVVKNASSFWLEYNFGWKNLVTTIYESINVCQAAWPDVIVRGRKTVGFGNVLPNNGTEWINRTVSCTIRCHLQAKMRITNPNLLLAESLGLVNPAHVFWDWLPFSYMVDWVANVGKWLKSWTNFAGVTLIDTMTTMSYTGTYSADSIYMWNGKPKINSIPFFHMNRTLGLPSYQFVFNNPLQPFDGWKASIVFATLVGILTGMKAKASRT